MSCTNKIPYTFLVFIAEENNLSFVKDKVMNLNKRNNLGVIVVTRSEIAKTNFHI